MLNVGYINGTTSLFEARHYRYVNDVLASPLRWWEVNGALVTGGIVREVLTAAGILALGVPLTGIGVQRPAILLAAAIAALVIGAQLGVLVGSYARSLDQVYGDPDPARAAAGFPRRHLLPGQPATRPMAAGQRAESGLLRRPVAAHRVLGQRGRTLRAGPRRRIRPRRSAHGLVGPDLQVWIAAQALNAPASRGRGVVTRMA
jgi:hypothetical protein